MNRTAAEKAAEQLRDGGFLGDWDLAENSLPNVADVIERACGQDDAIAGSCPSCRKAWVNGCADCGKPLFQTFKADDDGRVFHYECGGAEFAKRMAVLPGTPEFNRLRACGQDEPGFDEATETRWQTAIYELCKKDYPEVDGSGCESGDALDVTLSEISQTIELVRSRSCGGTAWPGKGEHPDSLDATTESELLATAASWVERHGGFGPDLLETLRRIYLLGRERARGQDDEQELPALPREFTTKKAKIGSIRERPVFPIEDEVGDRSCGETAWESRKPYVQGRLDEFQRIKRKRPVDPIYWDMHEERGLREELAACPSPPTGRTEEK